MNKLSLRQNRILSILLIGLVVMNTADYLFTVRALSWGIPEGNIFMASLAHSPWFPFIKLGVVNGGLLLVWLVRDRIFRIISLTLVGFGIVFVAYLLVTVWHIYGQFF